MAIHRPSWEGLLAAFGAVALSFIVSTVVAERSAGSIHELAQAIARDTLPSIERLSEVRSDLLDLQVRANELLQASEASRPVVRAELARLQAEARQAMDDYRALPATDGERALNQGMAQALEESLAATDELLRDDQAGQRAEAQALVQHRLRPAMERASDESRQLVRFNADQAQALTQAIDQARQRSTRLAVGLDVLCGLFAVAAGLLATRAVRAQLDAEATRRELVEARARELEAFADRVAHDVLNPLNVIHLSLEAMRRDGQAGGPETLERARRGVRRVQDITRGLLDFARSGARPGEGQRSPLRTKVEEVVAGFAEQAEAVRAELTLEPGPSCEVACHPGVLVSLASNLVGNALKYLGDAPVRRVTVRASCRGRRARLEVEDTGPGVPPELAQAIFEPHVRANRGGEPGIGLGLATVRRLAEAHGGEAGFTPARSGGSVFWVELPLAA